MKNEKEKNPTLSSIMNTMNTDCNFLFRNTMHEILNILVSNTGAANIIVMKV